MELEIRPIRQDEYQRTHAFQCEYLDAESFQDFARRIEANPDLYLVAFYDDELVGICYGHPSEKDTAAISLQGIAVNLDEKKGYARVGIGSKMMRVFESTVRRRGYKKIGVGSADNQKVEHFYLKNEFKPCELVAKGSLYRELDRVKIDDYELGKAKQQELRQKYDAIEVIFIFEKSIDDINRIY